MRHHGSASDVDALLEQAAAFVRAGDYMEAQARVRCARAALGESADAKARAAVARALQRCDALVENWQAENAARSAAYLAREQKAIGADKPRPVEDIGAWRRTVARLRSAWTSRHHAERPGPLRAAMAAPEMGARASG